ncbi:MAG: hypothetical protein WC971_03465 [Coriobacteriia bacterium]
MRAVTVVVAAVVVLLLAACSAPGGVSDLAVPGGEPTASTSASGPPSVDASSTDALLVAASRASSARPVRIVGYELVLWEKGRLDFEVFMTKSGRLLTPQRLWGAGPEFAPLEERPPARVRPESEAERQAQEHAISRALELSVAEGWGSDEAMVRIYLLEDAAGDQFLLSPDGTKIVKAPVLEPWGER